MNNSECQKQNAKTFISLGSNVGDRETFLSKAKEGLKMVGEIIDESSVYETQPLGNSKRDFLNQVLEFETKLNSKDLIKNLKKIEQKLGRKKRGKWEEREIDIDLLFYGNEISWSQDLKVPHAESNQRKFVLKPLSEIAPNFIHPVFGLSVKTLLKFCPDKLTVKKWIPKSLKK